MQIDPAIVGTKLEGLTYEVSWRNTTNYAAALDDTNPMYLDDTRPGGIIAPPLFPVVISWPMIADMPGRLQEGIPPEAIATMVHASEQLIVHRMIRPGDRIRLEGEVCAVVPTSAGCYVVLRLEGEDANGDPVFTEYTGAIFRGVECVGEGVGKDRLPVRPLPDPEAKPVWEEPIPVSRSAPFLYDGCTDIIFPIHTSRAFATGVGLPDIVLQGTAALAMATKVLVERGADSDPTRLVEIACRFSGYLIPGSTMKLQRLPETVVDKKTYRHFQLLNPLDQLVLGGFVRFED